MNHWFKSHLLYLFVVEPPIWKICASQIGSSNQISGWKENIFNVWSENLNSYNIRSGIPSDAFRSRRLKVIILDKLAHWPASSAPGPRIPAAPAATWIQCQVDQKHPWSFTFDRMLREGLAHHKYRQCETLDGAVAWEVKRSPMRARAPTNVDIASYALRIRMPTKRPETVQRQLIPFAIRDSFTARCIQTRWSTVMYPMDGWLLADTELPNRSCVWVPGFSSKTWPFPKASTDA